jgi:hypothetical protein
VKHGEKTYEYVQIVESKRVDGKPRQQVIESLGRLQAKDPGQALQMAEVLIRFFRKEAGQATQDDGVLGAGTARSFGDLVAVEEAWRALGLDRLFSRLGRDRNFAFPPERALFAMVAQRLLAPGSKLACADWLKNDVHYGSIADLDEDDLYATLTWLEEVTREAEVSLFEKLKRDGKCEPTAFFYDTTATWFEGRGPEGLAEFGRPRAGQPLDRRIVLLGLVRSREGWPIAHRVFAGNRADVSTVVEIIEDLRTRFGITRFVFVGDRGMVSDAVIAHLDAHGLSYVLAMRMRSSKKVRDGVLGRAGRFRVVLANLHVKEVMVGTERYIVCKNPASVERDLHRREDIVAKLRAELRPGTRATSRRGGELRANRAYKRYLAEKDGVLVVSDAKVRRDARNDGKWVLRTNVVDEDAALLAETYKALGGIERDFRDLKSFIELRPMYHRTEPRVRAHVFVCVLAKAVLVELERRMGPPSTRPFTVEHALKLLGRVQAIPIRIAGQQFWTRSDFDDETLRAIELLQIPLRRLPRSLGHDPV